MMAFAGAWWSALLGAAGRGGLGARRGMTHGAGRACGCRAQRWGARPCGIGRLLRIPALRALSWRPPLLLVFTPTHHTLPACSRDGLAA
jgi:hypothetical protein